MSLLSLTARLNRTQLAITFVLTNDKETKERVPDPSANTKLGVANNPQVHSSH